MNPTIETIIEQIVDERVKQVEAKLEALVARKTLEEQFAHLPAWLTRKQAALVLGIESPQWITDHPEEWRPDELKPSGSRSLYSKAGCLRIRERRAPKP